VSSLELLPNHVVDVVLAPRFENDRSVLDAGDHDLLADFDSGVFDGALRDGDHHGRVVFPHFPRPVSLGFGTHGFGVADQRNKCFAERGGGMSDDAEQPNFREQAIEMSRERFECSNCGFAAEDREEFDVDGLAMTCPECRSVRVEHVFTADDDDDLPQSFEELASTCESCGEDVESERLIEGECPGCHYHEPDLVADGGTTIERLDWSFAAVVHGVTFSRAFWKRWHSGYSVYEDSDKSSTGGDNAS